MAIAPLEPRVNDLYRNKITTCLYRVLSVDYINVAAVHEASIPCWTWAGDRLDFLKEFTFVTHHAYSHFRI